LKKEKRKTERQTDIKTERNERGREREISGKINTNKFKK
jgi:hypothetical protein